MTDQPDAPEVNDPSALLTRILTRTYAGEKLMPWPEASQDLALVADIIDDLAAAAAAPDTAKPVVDTAALRWRISRLLARQLGPSIGRYRTTRITDMVLALIDEAARPTPPSARQAIAEVTDLTKPQRPDA